MTFDGSNMKFYVDGIAVTTTNSSSSELFDFDINSLVIGGNTIGGTTTAGSFLGNIRGARVYDSSLSSEQVLEIYRRDINDVPEPSTLFLLLPVLTMWLSRHLKSSRS